MEQEQNLCLTTIVNSKARFYPRLLGKELEFSVFDVSMRKFKGKKLFYIGVKILGDHELFMVQVKNLNLSEMQFLQIRDAAMTKEIPLKRSDLLK